jgi:hypothetical protein
MKVTRLSGSSFAAFGMPEGAVDQATIIVGDDGLREFRVHAGFLDSQKFELVAKETKVGSNYFKGTWKYIASATIKSLASKSSTKATTSGEVSLRLYGENPCALVGEYEEEGTTGSWVFQLDED